MSVRAVLFDVYGTLLELGPGPGPDGARTAWESLGGEIPGLRALPDFAQFTAACEAVIAREHAVARARGVGNPEVFWPDVVAEVVPDVGRLAATDRDAFLLRLAGLSRTVRLAPGAAPVLRRLADRGVPLGIASNAQPYTQAELARALASFGLTMALFEPALCHWSFENGFSKPNPHVFQLLGARLRRLGVTAAEALMVGDRLDNDVQPALAFGWQAWHLQLRPGRDWEALGAWLEQGESDSVL